MAIATSCRNVTSLSVSDIHKNMINMNEKLFRVFFKFTK